MALTDSQSSKLSATIAENAAAEAKSYADLASKSEDFSNKAEASAVAAAASETSSEESASSAMVSASNAADSETSASISAQNATLASNVYTSVTAAQEAITAGTIPLGALFNIASSIDTAYIDQYTNTAGVATPTGKQYPSLKYIQQVSSQIPNGTGETINGLPLIGFAGTNGDDIAIWATTTGAIDFVSAGPMVKSDINNYLNVNGLTLSTIPSLSSPTKYPIHSVGDDVDIWSDNGVVNLYDLNLINPSALNIQKAKYTQPMVTNGNTLYRWKSKRAKLGASQSAVCKILFTGDSWTEFVTIPERFSSWLYGVYGKSADGWISVQGDYYLNGTTLSRSGWTLYDANINTTPPTYGCALDGMSITSTTTTSTVSVAGLTATNISIYYRDGDGTFRYSIDGGSATSVTGSGTNTTKALNITGLSNIPHNIAIDTIGNSGNVTLYGFYGTSPSVNGVEVIKAGNAGARGLDFQTKISGYIGKYATDINPDMVVVILGTNDYRGAGITIDSFIGGIDTIVQSYRTANPDVGIVFICPAQSNGTPNPNPLSKFINSATTYCMQNGVEYVDLFSAFPSYSEANSLGMWIDTLHLNSVGAQFLVNMTKDKLI
ncbi:Uncharacterised protein [Serratia quinivorans]|uniref:SGNH/GDSL hydrolase family protein n=1 Tax=Serratia quinivorans TaxID=137545 RepID=UPI00217AAE76|nr:SGNH/GDSL hydrolase family protein [Serratia quinivorans]CAI1824726.1 Uncharacterised protein [Serratia quinivorans]